MERTRQSKKRAATQEVPETNPSDNQVADYDKNYEKSINRDRIIYPSSKSMPAINITYTNTDHFTTKKNLELLEFVERAKPHIIAICEVKPKIPR